MSRALSIACVSLALPLIAKRVKIVRRKGDPPKETVVFNQLHFEALFGDRRLTLVGRPAPGVEDTPLDFEQLQNNAVYTTDMSLGDSLKHLNNYNKVRSPPLDVPCRECVPRHYHCTHPPVFARSRRASLRMPPSWLLCWLRAPRRSASHRAVSTFNLTTWRFMCL